MSSKIEAIKLFSQNKVIQTDLSYFDSLANFFEETVDQRLGFYEKKKEEYQNKKVFFEKELVDNIKIKNSLQKYMKSATKFRDDPESDQTRMEKCLATIDRFHNLEKTLDENINFIKNQISKINKKMSYNKPSIMALISNHLKTAKMKARDDSLPFYTNSVLLKIVTDNKISNLIKQKEQNSKIVIPLEIELKIEEIRNDEMSKIHIRYYNASIMSGLDIIFDFFK